MKRKWFGRRGTITMFLCLILSALIVLETVFVAGAYMRKQEVELTEAVSHQVEQIMSQFDRDALNWYGIYGIADVEAGDSVFNQMTSSLKDTSFQYELTNELDETSMEASILDYMKLRGLAFEGNGILERLGFSIGKINGVDLDHQGGISSWMPSFQDYVENRNKHSMKYLVFRATCELTGLGDLLDDFDAFVDDLAEVSEREGSAMLQAGDSSAFVSLFDPSSMASLTSLFDGYMDMDLPSIMDRLLINEYAAFSFDSRVQEYESDDGYEPESNIIGIPFSEIHEDPCCDLEYLLIGSDRASINKFISFNFLLGTRLLLDFSAFLMDDTKREIALGIGMVISVLIACLSFGTVVVDPTTIQYVILFMMAYVQAFFDALELVSGQTVTLFYNDAFSETLGDFAETEYRDYFRVYLLFVPKDKLLSRMKDVIERDCGQLYTGVSAVGNLQGRAYQVERRYELYEKFEQT